MTWDEMLSDAHSTTIKMLEQKNDGMTNEAVPVENIKKAIEEMRVLQKQEDKGIAYYNPPFYCERCINILMKICKIEEVKADVKS